MVILHFAKREFESILYATARLFSPLRSSLTALPIQRSSIFACDHASEKHFQEVSTPMVRMARRLIVCSALSTIIFSQVFFPSMVFMPL